MSLFFYSNNAECSVLELGCGSGSTVYPLLEAIPNPNLKVYCCDFSSKAIDLVKEHSSFSPTRCVPFVLDATDADAWQKCPLQPDSLDFVLMIFAVSAMEPAKMHVAIENAARCLKYCCIEKHIYRVTVNASPVAGPVE